MCESQVCSICPSWWVVIDVNIIIPQKNFNTFLLVIVNRFKVLPLCISLNKLFIISNVSDDGSDSRNGNYNSNECMQRNLCGLLLAYFPFLVELWPLFLGNTPLAKPAFSFGRWNANPHTHPNLTTKMEPYSAQNIQMILFSYQWYQSSHSSHPIIGVPEENKNRLNTTGEKKYAWNVSTIILSSTSWADPYFVSEFILKTRFIIQF